MNTKNVLVRTLKHAGYFDGQVIRQCRRQLACCSSLLRRTFIMRKDRTDKHNEMIEIDKTDKHRYYRWNYQPLPTQTSLDESNPMFAIRSPEFKLPNPRGRLQKKKWRQRMAELQQARRDPELEKLSRSRKLLIPLDDIEKEWQTEFGLFDVQNLARFYGITKDLFETEDIVLNTWLDVAFDDMNIHRGNIVTASQLQTLPDISYEGSHDQLYSLIVSNLDGHPTNSSKEIIHWIICNMKGDVSSGDTFVEFLSPTPWKGTGYHRVVYSLYEQTQPIEKLHSPTPINSKSIGSREMSSCSIAKENDLKLAGLAWCQATWDESVSSNWKQYTDLHGEPIYDWEDYVEPKLMHASLKKTLNELKYRNM